MSKASSIQWSGRTHRGRVRQNNEDSFIALTVDNQGFQYLGKNGGMPFADHDFVFAVSDGMGGAKSGEFASKITVQKIADLLPRNFKLGAMGFSGNHPDILAELIDQIQKEMQSMSFHYEECRGMGATLTLVWLTHDWLYYAHVGDSRLYYLPASGTIKQLTADHTRAAELLRKGLISEYEAKSHPERNVLTNVLGGKIDNVTPQIGSVGFNQGDQFILCTDGVSEGVRPHRVETLLRQPPPRFSEMDVAERLITDAIEESGQDNCTAIVLNIG